MANLCDFSMVIVANNVKNIETFHDWITQNGTTWMGRGAEVDFFEIEDDEKYRAELSGWCKWSIKSALIDNAISMRTEPQIWSGGEYDRNGNKLRFVTLGEACAELELKMEVYSAEPGCEFQEHYLFRDGKFEINECVHYEEIYNEETGEYDKIGGFDWEFEI